MDVRALVDDALEVSVVGELHPGGHRGPPPPLRLDAAAGRRTRGRTVLITGPTSGLGRAATDALAALGARVVLVGRSEERLAAVRDALVAAHGEDRFPIVVADMGSLASVRAAVARVLATEPRLDVLVDNAGAIFPERIEGPDGIEATLATLVVGPFVLVSGCCRCSSGRAGRGSSPSRRAACTRSGSTSTTCRGPPSRSPARAPTPGRSGSRSRSSASGRADWAAGARASPSTRCTRAGPTRRASPSRCRASTALMRPLLRSPAEGVDTIVWLAAAPDAGRAERRAVPGSPATAVRPDPADAALGRRSSPPVGPRRGAVRGARSVARGLTGRTRATLRRPDAAGQR